MIDVARFLSARNLTLDSVMSVSVRDARETFAGIRAAHGLKHAATPLLTAPDGNIKLKHSETSRVAAYGLNLLPSDASGQWNTCRYATKGCRLACLATSGQAGMERRAGRDRIFRARRAKLAFLMAAPEAFLRLLVHEIDALPVAKWAAADFAVSLRLNVLSDIPWETVAPFILGRATDRGIVAYDYTAWPTARRSRTAATAAGLYLVDSVKETHTDAQIRAMARPVVVFDVPRGRPLPATFLGRPVVDADVSDFRPGDTDGTVRGLRYKHVATTTAADALASGFVKHA